MSSVPKFGFFYGDAAINEGDQGSTREMVIWVPWG